MDSWVAFGDQATVFQQHWVTEWSPACFYKVLPRGHQTGNQREPQMEEVPNLINICPTNPIQVLRFLKVFVWCPSNDAFDILF